eukprot:CAMPEP_0194058472 /NCGR_PEP_ID=MMETSP0009_2-20130614/66379_1 /TAXON_ID=210454 /ORGANISM="Grammatophora oceanica, Strain CCMP 410" /LENGTH=175 /DNA_ID=CAMNT_0038708633 /DNA_START=71 /DNA_END=595 /DNA_ORIENTATION=+
MATVTRSGRTVTVELLDQNKYLYLIKLHNRHFHRKGRNLRFQCLTCDPHGNDSYYAISSIDSHSVVKCNARKTTNQAELDNTPTLESNAAIGVSDSVPGISPSASRKSQPSTDNHKSPPPIDSPSVASTPSPGPTSTGRRKKENRTSRASAKPPPTAATTTAEPRRGGRKRIQTT